MNNLADRKPRILVVGGNPDTRWLIVLHLKREGYEVAEADDTEQAVARAVDFPPSLVILDAAAPDDDGISAFHELKGHARTNQLPVIFLSEKSDPQSRAESLQLGVEDYLSKPLDLKVLMWRVRAAIQRHAIRTLFTSAAQSA